MLNSAILDEKLATLCFEQETRISYSLLKKTHTKKTRQMMCPTFILNNLPCFFEIIGTV